MSQAAPAPVAAAVTATAYPLIGRRSVWTLSILFGIFGLLAGIGACATLVRSDAVPAAGIADTPPGSEPFAPGVEQPGNLHVVRTRPPRGQLLLTGGIGFALAAIGWTGFLLRRRRAGLFAQRALGFALLLNALYLPSALTVPYVWSALAVLLMCVAGIWMLLACWHPGPAAAPP